MRASTVSPRAGLTNMKSTIHTVAVASAISPRMANAVLTKRRFPGVMTRFSNADAPKGVVTENRSLCPASTRQVHRLHARHLWTRHSGEPSRSARAQNHRPGHHPQIVHGAGGELVPT